MLLSINAPGGQFMATKVRFPLASNYCDSKALFVTTKIFSALYTPNISSVYEMNLQRLDYEQNEDLRVHYSQLWEITTSEDIPKNKSELEEP